MLVSWSGTKTPLIAGIINLASLFNVQQHSGNPENRFLAFNDIEGLKATEQDQNMIQIIQITAWTVNTMY